MKLRNPFIKENFSDQPYFSMLIIAPNCNGICEGCQNKNLLNYNIKDYNFKQLFDEYNSNLFYQGITVGGLEIFDSGKQFLEELIFFIEQAKIKKITIYTRYEITDKCVQELLNKIKKYEWLEELYIKTGSFKLKSKTKTLCFESHNGKKFEIKLASDNQNFIRVV